MQYLLDTQILIWSLEDNPKLHASLRTLVENPAHTMFVSQFSLMENVQFRLISSQSFLIQ
jgi:PIN domain nuclease of toxin-antitoxin system